MPSLKYIHNLLNSVEAEDASLISHSFSVSSVGEGVLSPTGCSVPKVNPRVSPTGEGVLFPTGGGALGLVEEGVPSFSISLAIVLGHTCPSTVSQFLA